MSFAGVSKVLEDLQGLGKIGKPRGRGRTNHVFDCPFHSAGKRQATPSFGVHAQNGKWNCFNKSCGRKGTSIQALYAALTGTATAEAEAIYPKDLGATDDIRAKLSARAGKDVPQPMAPYPRTVPIESDPAALAYMRARKIPRHTWEAMGAAYAPDARLASSFSGRGTVGGRRIIIPIRLSGGAMGFMGRSIGEDPTPKWRPISNAGKVLYDPMGLMELPPTSAFRAIVLVEGEFDSGACMREGLPVAGCLQAYLSYEKAVLLQSFDKIITMFDGDKAGRDGTSLVFADHGRMLKGKLASFRLPDGYDPASLPAGFGAAVWAKIREKPSFADALKGKLHV